MSEETKENKPLTREELRKVHLLAECLSNGMAGVVRECACGRIFYCDDPSADYGEGELEAYAADPKATCVDGDGWIGEFRYANVTYALPCDCWHPKLHTLVQGIECYAEAIMQYLARNNQFLTEEVNTRARDLAVWERSEQARVKAEQAEAKLKRTLRHEWKEIHQSKESNEG